MPIMQQENVAALDVARQFLKDGIGALIHRIETASCPARQTQIKAGQDGIEQWTAKPGGRTKKSREFARYRPDNLLRAFNLSRYASRPQHGKMVQVPLAVIFDSVTPPHDFAGKLGVLLDPLADAKESSFDGVLIEQRQHAWRYLRVRSIVDRDCDAANRCNLTWQAGPVWTEHLASRPQSRRRQQQVIRHDGSPSIHVQSRGRAMTAAAAPMCRATVALMSPEGRQRL